jgi:hypothetical protein
MKLSVTKSRYLAIRAVFIGFFKSARNQGAIGDGNRSSDIPCERAINGDAAGGASLPLLMRLWQRVFSGVTPQRRLTEKR